MEVEVVDSKEEEVANITTNQALTTNKSSLPELCNRRERTVHLWLSRRWTSLRMRVLLPVMRTTSMDSQNKFQGFRGVLIFFGAAAEES